MITVGRVKVFAVDEVSKKFNVTGHTIRRYVKEGKLSGQIIIEKNPERRFVLVLSREQIELLKRRLIDYRYQTLGSALANGEEAVKCVLARPGPIPGPCEKVYRPPPSVLAYRGLNSGLARPAVYRKGPGCSSVFFRLFYSQLRAFPRPHLTTVVQE